MNFIRILPGDKVTLEMSPYDLIKGAHHWRLEIEQLVRGYRYESETFRETHLVKVHKVIKRPKAA